MAPVKYIGTVGESINLLAFSTTGVLMANKEISFEPYEITGGAGFGGPSWLPTCIAMNWWNLGYPCMIVGLLSGNLAHFESPEVGPPLAGAGFPLAGVAILPDPQGGRPRVVATDRKHAKAVYAFSPETGFTELSRSTTGRYFTTPPVVRTDGMTVVGTLEGYLTHTAANLREGLLVSGFGPLTAAPTRHRDGSLLVVSRDGYVTKIKGGVRSWLQYPGGSSIASAASSCTHVYVSTTDAFATFDARTMQQVGRISWYGRGGLSAPVIGMGGRVYVISNHTLYVFPGPPLGDIVSRTACDVLATAP